MNKKNQIWVVITSVFVMISCQSAPTKETSLQTLSLDIDESFVYWKGYESLTDTAKYHMGTVAFIGGKVILNNQNGNLTIESGEVIVDMNSIKESNDLIELEDNLKSVDFFYIEKFSKANFVVEKQIDNILYGTAYIIGQKFPLESEINIVEKGTDVLVEISSFHIDFSQTKMLFFMENLKNDIENQHNPNLEFSINLVLHQPTL